MNTQDLRAAWPRLQQACLDAMPQRIEIDSISGIPLKTLAAMPPQAGFEYGQLLLSLQDLRLRAPFPGKLTLEQESDRAQVLALRLEDWKLLGKAQLQGLQERHLALDAYGNGMPLGPDGEPQRLGGGDPPPKHPDWIDNANAQRERLQSIGGNGPDLLLAYSTHRTALGDLFSHQLGYTFRRIWQGPGMTEVATDTHLAVKNNTVINQQGKTYGNAKASYNEMAGNQQLAVVSGLQLLIQHLGDPNGQYAAAIQATLQFNSSILSNTNQQQVQNIPEHTPDQVYQLVQTGKPAAQLSKEEIERYLNGEQIGGRDQEGRAWSMMMSEDQRAFWRMLQAEQDAHVAFLAARKPLALHTSPLRATLDAMLYLELDSQGGVQAARVELEGFDLELDDSGWDEALGAALAQEAREAMQQARFLKSLLHDRVADALERSLVPAITQALQEAQ
ncbi:hypothetical protein V8J88_09040 [Massilia sp. W12]|uniref:hypothetical protein n=1 Tax=Massilia sp. W12 TaxID=3126507 RepID=UPI0030D2BD60